MQVMEMSKRMLGHEHPDTLTSMANFASSFWNQERWKEAEGLQVQVMETRKRVLRQEHPDTLTSMATFTSTYGVQGRWRGGRPRDCLYKSWRRERECCLHGQPCVDIPKSRAVEGGQGSRGASHGESKRN